MRTFTASLIAMGVQKLAYVRSAAWVSNYTGSLGGRGSVRCLMLAWVAGLFLWESPGWPAETTQPPALAVFHVGMSKICFRNVNRNDATAAFRAFLERNGRLYGHDYRADIRIFDNTPSFEAAIQQGPMHLVVMTPWQFLMMDVHQLVKPYCVVAENGQVGRKYLVLTRRDSGLQTLADLRGKSVLQLEVASDQVGKLWLDSLLLAGRLGSQDTFFERVEVVAKPTAAILPVFFGKKPACVVDEPSFALMTELNPQVGRNLQAVAVSETLVDVVICLREQGWDWEKEKTDTVKSLQELHLTPSGQQILTLFKISQMIPFQETHLDTVRNLRATFERLRKESKP